MSAERDHRAAYLRRFRLYGRAAAFLLGALLVLTTALHAQDPHAVVAVRELAQDEGITICHEGRTYSFILDGMSYAETNVVARHEQTHREQAKRFGNVCSLFNAWYDTPAGKLDAEAEAYMAALCLAVDYGADPLTIRQDYAQRIATYFGGDINQLEIRAAMKRYDTCPLKASDFVTPESGVVMPGWQ